MPKHDMRVIGISPAFRLRLAYTRAGNRLFCWVAHHSPHLAQWWVLRK